MESNDPPIGIRLRIARLLHGLTQAELAKEVQVSAAALCQIEAGAKQPGADLLGALAVVLKVDEAFFRRAVIDEFRDDECFFRRRRTTAMYMRSQALAHGTFLSEFVSFLEKRVTLPPHDVPDIQESTSSIEQIAETCRTHWDLGLDAPITNMTRVLENAGVVVADFASTKKIDAFSRIGARRLVVRNNGKPSRSRLRFDLAHECGHLVMHIGLDPSDVELEKSADAFASAFLLPRKAFVAEFPRSLSPNWDALRVMKRRWGASLAAIVRRAYDLRIVDALYYQRAYKYLSASGWKTNEPDEGALPAEQPELIQRSLSMLQDGLRIYPQDIARSLRWSPEIFTMVTGHDCNGDSGAISLDSYRTRVSAPARS